jgi:hypothetical protein
MQRLCINNFHNTGQYPNVKFSIHHDLRRKLGQGMYVKLANRLRDFDGVKHNEELLVSYGKGYWRGRVGNLTDFMWRLPKWPMSKGGRLSSEKKATTDENV